MTSERPSSVGSDVTIEFDDNESAGLHPRWDAGAAGWSKWRKQGYAVGVNSSGWKSEEWSDEKFALAVSEQPLLDDDALVLRARGGEVGSDGLCVRASRWFRQMVGPSVSLYWQEKLVVLVQTLQMYALLVVISETDNMLPTQWRVFVKWTHYLLLQFDETEMLDYVPSGKRQWTIQLLATCSGVCICYIAYWVYLRFSLRDRFRNRALIERLILTGGQLVYLPVCLAAIRIFKCQDNGPLGLDFVCESVSGTCKSEISCSDSTQYIYMVIAAMATVLVVIGIPAGAIWAVKVGVISDHVKRHARDVRCREAERLLGLSNVWENLHFHLFSSFIRRQVGYKIRTMIIMLFMAAAAVVTQPEIKTVGDNGESTDRSIHIGSFTFLLLLDFVLDVSLGGLPFRHASSNFILLTLKLNLLTTSIYAALRGFSLTNAFLVDRKLTAFLWVQGAAVLIFFFLVVIFCIVQHVRKGSDIWMTSLKNLYKELDQSDEIIQIIRRSHAACARYEMSLPEFIDVELLNGLINDVQREIPRAEKNESLFMSTLRETLTVLVEIRARAGTASYFHKLQTLRNSMATFRQRLDARDKALIFMPKKKKMMLLKLVALRFLIGNRKIASLPASEWAKNEY